MLLERNKVLFKAIEDLNNDVLTGKQVMSKDTLEQRLTRSQDKRRCGSDCADQSNRKSEV